MTDLKARGLFDQTVVIVGSEFGRTPMVQSAGQLRVNQGRDHNVSGISTLLGGGGIKGGITYGATDEFGLTAVEKPVHPHDLHATVAASSRDRSYEVDLSLRWTRLPLD